MSQQEPSAQQRRAAERNAAFYGAHARQFFLVGVLLAVFLGVEASAGADRWTMGLLLAFTALAFGGALHRAVQRHRRFKVARTGQLAEGLIREVERRPGMREGDPNEYSMLVEPQIPGAEPVWIRARFEPPSAKEIFGRSLPFGQMVEPDDLRLPIVVSPASPGLVVLAV